MTRSRQRSPEPRAAGSSSVAGTVWQRWAAADGKRERASRTQGKVTVVVDGTAGWPELEQLAGSAADPDLSRRPRALGVLSLVVVAGSRPAAAASRARAPSRCS